MFIEIYKRRLDVQKKEGLYRNPPEIERREGKYVYHKTEKLLSFASNDYLGIGSSKSLADTVGRHFGKRSASSSSSRLVAGNYSEIGHAERTYANYFGYESAIFFPSGYQANLAVLSTLFGTEDIVFFDKHVHASCVKGMAISKATLKGYRHNCLSHLKKRMGHFHGRPDGISQAAVVTESLFSMDGDLLDVERYREIKQASGFFGIVDEAHAFGALGPGGRGIAGGAADIALGTFGKAIGLFGAFVLLPEIVREYLFNFASPLIYTTTLPEAHAASAVDILGLVASSDEKRETLKGMSAFMREALAKNGFSAHGDAHIIAVEIGNEALASAISKELLNRGVLAFSARYPTVPAGKAILRLGMTADHDENDVAFFMDALKQAEAACRQSG